MRLRLAFNGGGGRRQKRRERRRTGTDKKGAAGNLPLPEGEGQG